MRYLVRFWARNPGQQSKRLDETLGKEKLFWRVTLPPPLLGPLRWLWTHPGQPREHRQCLMMDSAGVRLLVAGCILQKRMLVIRWYPLKEREPKQDWVEGEVQLWCKPNKVMANLMGSSEFAHQSVPIWQKWSALISSTYVAPGCPTQEG